MRKGASSSTTTGQQQTTNSFHRTSMNKFTAEEYLSALEFCARGADG
jgi:hypothetical protein